MKSPTIKYIYLNEKKKNEKKRFLVSSDLENKWTRLIGQNTITKFEIDENEKKRERKKNKWILKKKLKKKEREKGENYNNI